MLTKLWEVPDILPKHVSAVVGMSVAHLKDGSVGRALRPIIHECADELLHKTAQSVIFSNRFNQNGVILSEVMREETIGRRVSSTNIILPDSQRNLGIHNTFSEAEFAIQTCKKNGWKSLLVVANHIHMRRCLAAFRVVMERENYQITLFHKSVGRDGYGSNASAQHRFRHPLLFLSYEIFVALPASILLGWWKI